jgi:hypothetical protein
MATRKSTIQRERFDIEAGTPESTESSEWPSPCLVVSAVVSPGLAGVATISLATPTIEAGVCRCGACLALPRDIHWLE